MACLRGWLVTLVAFAWLFSTVCFQMCPQSTCITGCILTLVAFVWFFPTVHFQMCPQIACPRRGIVTLVAFIRLFSTVRFQMCPQIACMRRCIVTLIASMWLNDIVSLFSQDFHISWSGSLFIIIPVWQEEVQIRGCNGHSMPNNFRLVSAEKRLFLHIIFLLCRLFP